MLYGIQTFCSIKVNYISTISFSVYIFIGVDFELWEFLADMDKLGLFDDGEYFVITMYQDVVTENDKTKHIDGKLILSTLKRTHTPQRSTLV